jgi:DNA-binding NarL/FixJ family response regulator
MEQRTEQPQPLSGMRVLVADDEILIALDLGDILGDAGAEIVGPCGTLAEALRAAEEPELSAAVLDVRLGRDTTETVAARLAERGVPFVFYRGQALPDTMRAMSPHARVLIKPTRQAVLLEAVVGMIGRS